MDKREIGKDETKSASQTSDKSQCEKNSSRWRRFKEWVKQKSSFTDWCIAFFTLALAVASIYQFIIIGHQLDVMRKDQRAWLKFEALPDTPGEKIVKVNTTSGQPVIYPFRVINTGKTPAKNIVVKTFMNIVDASQEAPLNHVESNSSYMHKHTASGIIFPNSDFKESVFLSREDGSPRILTDDEARSIRDGKAYMAVYGIITYDDIFGTHRWTKFCNWIAMPGTFHTVQCVKYNSVDDN